MLLTEIKHPSYSGEKNSQHGTIWVYRADDAKKIKRVDLGTHQADGWFRGRVPEKTAEQKKQASKLAHEKRKKFQLYCAHCKSAFLGKAGQKNCSKECSKWETGKNAAQSMTTRGTHSGWHTRKGEASYPEKYIEDVFRQEDIDGWKREKKIGRWFIDFAFEDQMIAVEIDGRQHDDTERAESDKKKDEYLTAHGWKVIRIKWFNPRTEHGKEKLHPQVKSLLAQLK